MNTRILFMGTPEFAATVLENLCVSGFDIIAAFTQPDKPCGRHMKLTSPPVKEAAQLRNITVYQPPSLRTPEAEALFIKLKPDLIVTAAYGKILPPEILQIPQYGCLNVHASLLPKYRGAAPVQWAIMNGDSKTGITIMKMDEGMDTGDILSSVSCGIGEDINSADLMKELSDLGADLLVRTIPQYLSGAITPHAQNEEEATYSPPIRKEQGLIDWNRSAVEIHNQVRGLTAWPGAYTFYKGERMKIYCSQMPENGDEIVKQYFAMYGKPLPGSVVCAGKGVLAVMCGQGCIQLACIQPASCKRVLASQCAHNFSVSEILGR